LTSDATGNATWQNSNANTGFHVAKNTGQTIVNNTDVKIDFTSEITDDANAFNPTTDEWTIPSNGFYHLTTSLRFATNMLDNTPLIIEIRKNNFVLNFFAGRLTGVPSISITSNVTLVAGDKITVYMYQNSGASRFLTNNPADSFFSGYRVY